MPEHTFIMKSLKDIETLALCVADYCKHGFIILLEGEMGTGKTTFVSFLGKAFKSDQHVSSPTFSLIQVYDGVHPSSNDAIFITHVDLYRLNSVNDCEMLEIPALFEQEKGVLCMEWPEKCGSLLPKNYLKFLFSYHKVEQRKVEFQFNGSEYEPLINALTILFK